MNSNKKVAEFLNKYKKEESKQKKQDNTYKWGKYKGKTYDEVLLLDPPYVCWILEKAEEKYAGTIKKYYIQKLET